MLDKQQTATKKAQKMKGNVLRPKQHQACIFGYLVCIYGGVIEMGTLPRMAAVLVIFSPCPNNERI